MIVTRYSYPATLVLIALLALGYWQWSKLKDLAHKIRNDKYGSCVIQMNFRYLIGTQLVNFYKEGIDVQPVE